MLIVNIRSRFVCVLYVYNSRIIFGQFYWIYKLCCVAEFVIEIIKTACNLVTCHLLLILQDIASNTQRRRRTYCQRCLENVTVMEGERTFNNPRDVFQVGSAAIITPSPSSLSSNLLYIKIHTLTCIALSIRSYSITRTEPLPTCCRSSLQYNAKTI